MAIGAVIIPLAIHLWSVKKGKTLKIGSIQLFGESSKQHSRSLRFQDLWLLLLRCLLLIILALLLAVPLIIEKAPAEKVKGWILLDKSHLQESYHAFKPGIDSLVKLGFQTHYFNPGFREFSLADTAKMEAGDRRDSISSLSYWSLAKALDDQLPVDARAYIFTGNHLNRFKGSRPLLRSNITWNTYSPADSVFNKITGAYLSQRDSLRLILAQSRPNGIFYSLENTSSEKINPAYELIGADQAGIRYNPSGSLKQYMDTSVVKIDTASIRIALYTDKHPADMAYVKAALEAVQSFSQRRISITTYRDPAKLSNGLNWLFWLSDEPINKNIKAKAANIFSYQAGKTVTPGNSTILASDLAHYSLLNAALFKRKLGNKPKSEGSVLWEDESGSPVLLQAPNGQSSELKFFSRFDPEWNELVWSPRFPEVLMELVFKQYEISAGGEMTDRRALAVPQIKPAVNKEPKSSFRGPGLKKSMLDRHLWVLLMVLFALERWVSYKQKSIAGND
ncbi:hypothetical protein GZH53_03200 [Flavihumibacter sp. R14]|nr:hypothetical protein [Flavihumibacter soli]